MLKINGGHGNNAHSLSVSNSGDLQYDGQAIIKVIADSIYPVGSLYWSTNSANPKTFLPGTDWEQIKDCFIWAKGDQTNLPSGQMYHTLTIDELPEHSHKNSINSGSVSLSNNNINFKLETRDTSSKHGAVSELASSTGSVNTTTGSKWQMIAVSGGTSHHNINNFDQTIYVDYTDPTINNSQQINNKIKNDDIPIMPPYLQAYCWKRIS
jgi:hypothetical protein